MDTNNPAGPKWRKSAHSNNGGECVEVADLGDAGAVGVRDSKAPDAGHLTFAPSDWAAFARAVKAGKYDQP